MNCPGLGVSGLIDSMDEKQLQTIGPMLVLNRFRQEQRVTSHFSYCLNPHFSDSEGEVGNGKPEGGRERRDKGNVSPIHARLLMILAEFVGDRGLLYRDAAQSDAPRALDEGHRSAGTMKRKGEVPGADRSDEIHRKDVRELPIRNAH